MTRAGAAIGAALLIALQGSAYAQAGAFAAPPRTIADITAILDQEKPDLERIAKLRADADAMPPPNADAATLVDFYYDRAVARQNLGRFRDSITDLKEGIALGLRGHVDVAHLRQAAGFQYNWSGDTQKALDEFLGLAKDSGSPPNRKYLFNAYRWISFLSIGLGNLEQAERYLKKNEALLAEAQSWPDYEKQKNGFRAQVEYSRGRLFEAHGRLRDAEVAYRQAEIFFTEMIAKVASPRRWSFEVVRDNMVASQAVVKAKQGRYAEAETDVRRALLSRLASVGKYSLTTATLIIPRFATVLLDQGRYGEAESLIRTEIEIFNALGVGGDSQYFVAALNNLASLQALQEQWSEAAGSYAAIDEATASWETGRKALLVNFDRILTLCNTDRVPEGVAAAKQLLARSATKFGPEHVDTAYAQAALGVGLTRENRDGEALEQFRRAMPIILSAGHGAESDDTVSAAAREQRARILAESYMSVLARSPETEPAAAESFPVADAVRAHSVQRALTLSGARLVAATPKLAELARREQDLAKLITAGLATLNGFLSKPSEQRDEGSVRDLRTRIDELRAEHAAVRNQLAAEFPTYAGLIDPKPPSVDAVRNMLKPTEALISFYFGSQNSFVWVVSPGKPVAFAALGIGASDIAAKIKKLRAALNPQAALVSEIPPFDVPLAHKLYKELLQPVEFGLEKRKKPNRCD